MLKNFGLDPEQGHIINGHTPVKEIDGENPIKADGKMIVIDGGFSKAYQSTTGIAGYTLLYNSFGMQLVAHQHFNSKKHVLLNGADELSIRRVVDKELKRKRFVTLIPVKKYKKNKYFKRTYARPLRPINNE